VLFQKTSATARFGRHRSETLLKCRVGIPRATRWTEALFPEVDHMMRKRGLDDDDYGTIPDDEVDEFEDEDDVYEDDEEDEELDEEFDGDDDDDDDLDDDLDGDYEDDDEDDDEGLDDLDAEDDDDR
jgi:hypothetical protein